MDEKKKFRETKVGQWLKKAGQKLPEIASVALEVATGDIAGAADKISDILNEKANADKEAAKLKVEWEKYLLEFQKELTQMELADRQDARAREVAFVNATGGRDWFQFIVGALGIILLANVIGVGLYGSIDNREVFFHVLGVTEGLGLTIFYYYFGGRGTPPAERTTKVLKK
jgi:hypothetical protein